MFKSVYFDRFEGSEHNRSVLLQDLICCRKLQKQDAEELQGVHNNPDTLNSKWTFRFIILEPLPVCTVQSFSESLTTLCDMRLNWRNCINKNMQNSIAAGYANSYESIFLLLKPSLDQMDTSFLTYHLCSGNSSIAHLHILLNLWISSNFLFWPKLGYNSFDDNGYLLTLSRSEKFMMQKVFPMIQTALLGIYFKIYKQQINLAVLLFLFNSTI